MKGVSTSKILDSVFKNTVAAHCPAYLALVFNKRKAVATINGDIKNGRLARPDRCVDGCGKSCAKPHAHHPDHSKYREVKWLCPTCHKRADMVAAARMRVWLFKIYQRRSELMPRSYPAAWYGPGAPEMNTKKQRRINLYVERQIAKIENRVGKPGRERLPHGILCSLHNLGLFTRI